MTSAMMQALIAKENGEVPVGAILIGPDGQILAEAFNSPVSFNDATAHAEILCLRKAMKKLGNYRLPPGCVMAVTLEPCIMCLGSMIHARLGGLVFGAHDPKTGAIVSQLPGPEIPFFNHRFWVIRHVLGKECGEMLSNFFRKKREK